MTPTALLTGDLHAHANHAFSRPLPNGRPSRFQDLLDVIDQIRLIIERTPSLLTLILGGDLTHRRHFISWKLYNPLYDALRDLTERVPRTYIIPGNHDFEDDGSTHSLHVLRDLPNTIVVDRPTQRYGVRHEGPRLDAFPVSFVPYMNDEQAIVEAFSKLPKELPVISHYAAEGAPMESDYWLPSPLPLHLVERFPLVFFHHIHKPSAQLDGKVCYVGAPMHFDFGDAGPRSIILTDWVTWERVEIAAPRFSTVRWPRLPMPQGPGYVRILNVPKAKMTEAKEMAEKMGWLGAVTLAESLPETVREAISSGLVLDRSLLEGYVEREAPTLPPEDKLELVEEGMAGLREARG